MAYIGNIGDNSSACPQNVPLNVYPGATITVANLAASPGTINYYNNGIENAASGTIAPNASQTFTAATVLTSSGGVSTVQITGTGY